MPDSNDLTEKTLGEFRLLRHLGSGGMADVYLAEQTSLQRYVAVKVMKPSMVATSGDIMLQRFKLEAMAAANLNHPNIVQVYTIGEQDGFHYIAQEFVQGRDLSSILRNKGAIDLNSALHVMRQAVSALKASGDAGIVHRDIKPDNIMIAKRGDVKIADFGLAQLGDTHGGGGSGGVTREGMTMGTPLYMSPEQVSGRELDPRSDVYSLGVTFYQLLCGKTPFTGTSPMAIAVQHLNKVPPRLEDQGVELPSLICRMVHRMMAKRRSLRYQSAGDVESDLKKIITAIKQKRSLDLLRLPILEELEKKAAEAKAGTETQAEPPPTVAKPRPRGGRTGDSKEIDLSAASSFELPVKAKAAPTKQMPAVKPSRAPVRSGRATKPTRPARKPPRADDDDDFLFARKKPEIEEMDLTPMVDVTFLLLIFFMITASFSLQKAFAVPPMQLEEGMSTTVTIEDPEAVSIAVQIDADDSYIFEDGDTVRTRDDLKIKLGDKVAQEQVTEMSLDIHPEATHGARVMAIDVATAVGITGIKNRIKDF